MTKTNTSYIQYTDTHGHEHTDTQTLVLLLFSLLGDPTHEYIVNTYMVIL